VSHVGSAAFFTAGFFAVFFVAVLAAVCFCARENPSARYRTIEVSVVHSFSSRILLSAAFIAVSAFAQSPDAGPATAAPEVKSAEIKPDLSDPGVVREQQNFARVRSLVQQGVLPLNDLAKAQDKVNDALDMSILRYSQFAADLTPEQADQMVTVAERLFLRSQKRSIQTKQLVATGIMARSEAETSMSDMVGAKLQLDLAMERARLVKDMALQKQVAEMETEAESHPEWNGKVYTRFDGNGVFTRADFNKISSAYLSAFGHLIPVSADGQTAVHTALGFNHAGRVDVALSPDSAEGEWLLRYLQRNRIPYFAFRTAVAHKATGAHIHLGPGSTRLASAATKTCCGS
jgi:hypothetical protein